MITMRPIEDERGFRKFALGDAEFSVDVLPPELRIKMGHFVPTDRSRRA